MLSKEVIKPVERLSAMAEAALERLSFGIEITAWEVRPIQMQTPVGPLPGWGVVYWTKNPLLGEGPLCQMTVVSDPNIPQEPFDAAIQEGCESLRNSRAQKLNGSHS